MSIISAEKADEFVRLQKLAPEAAAFLDALAGYLEREAEASAGMFRERDLRQEAADCRAMAKKLRGET